MPPSVLVTGGAGYIGSHVCKALRQAGFRPVVYDDLSRGHADAVRWGPLELGNVMNKERLKSVLMRYRPQAVMHFAGLAYVGESVWAPSPYYHVNTIGTLTLLQAMHESGIDRLVFSSTCAIYGPPQHLPIREDHPTSPVNPYGASKLMAERMVADCLRVHPLRAIVLRYFNAAGADPAGEIGEAHEPETHLVPLALEVAAGQRSHLTINGADYETFDGTCIRDYVHVSDLATAHVLALKRLSQGGSSATFNLGNGRGYSVREVIDTAERVTGRAIPTVVAARRSGDPAVLIADSSAARRELDWKPERASLELQIADAWRWYSLRQPSALGQAPFIPPSTAPLQVTPPAAF